MIKGSKIFLANLVGLVILVHPILHPILLCNFFLVALTIERILLWFTNLVLCPISRFFLFINYVLDAIVFKTITNSWLYEEILTSLSASSFPYTILS